MKNSTTKPIIKLITSIAVFVFWIAVWEIAAFLLKNEVVLPTPLSTLSTFISLALKPVFYKAVFHSITRIIIGYLCGVLAGLLGAVISVRFRLFSAVLSPIIKVIRAVPVASFIILAFMWFGSETLPVFITFLMVLPIVWVQVQSELENTDEKYLELAKLYRFSALKTFFKVKLPLIFPGFISAALTALGFAWKSGIAAEVICRPASSIGDMLVQAKLYIEMPEVFALTVTVALLSLLLEAAIKLVVRSAGYDKA